jgi:hypothetical protein
MSSKLKLRKVNKIEENLVEDNIGEAFLETKISEDNSNLYNNICIFGNRISKNRREYSDKAIESIARLAEGNKVYENHPSKSEIKDRHGVRVLRDFIGSLHGVNRRGEKIFVDEFKVHSTKTDLVKDFVENFSDFVGFSINASGTLIKNKDKVVVEDVTKLHSVDLVTAPATTKSLWESSNFEGDDNNNTLEVDNKGMDWKDITKEGISSNCPHIVEQILADSKQAEKLVLLETESKEKEERIKELEIDNRDKDEKLKKAQEIIDGKDKEIEKIQEELNTVKGKIEAYLVKEQREIKEEEINAVFEEKKVPDEIKKSETIRDTLRSIKEAKKVKTDDGKEIELSVKEQMVAKIDEFMEILSKRAKVINAHVKENINGNKGEISIDDFVRIVKKR